jgi:hypothetical protein
MNDSSIKTPEDLIREISLATITSLEEPYKAALDESFLCIFEKSIAYIVNLFRLFPTPTDANLSRHTRRPGAIEHLQNLWQRARQTSKLPSKNRWHYYGRSRTSEMNCT